jgi:hypothetical protein
LYTEERVADLLSRVRLEKMLELFTITTIQRMLQQTIMMLQQTIMAKNQETFGEHLEPYQGWSIVLVKVFRDE